MLKSVKYILMAAMATVSVHLYANSGPYATCRADFPVNRLHLSYDCGAITKDGKTEHVWVSENSHHPDMRRYGRPSNQCTLDSPVKYTPNVTKLSKEHCQIAWEWGRIP